jgi:nucleotidyltransferase/DNA polymerase involved in DNA repair
MFLAFQIPDFPAQAFAARHSGYRGRAFVVVRQSGENYKTEVYSCSSRARTAGIHGGMPVHLARRRCRDLAVVQRDGEAERRVLDLLEQAAESCTPQYRFQGKSRGILDLRETPLLRKYIPLAAAEYFKKEMTAATGLTEVALGMAGGSLLARMLAASAFPDGLLYCGPDKEDETLKEMSVHLLPHLSADCREKLEQYGLRNVGQVRRFSKAALTGRFGREGERLYYLCRGEDIHAEARHADPVKAKTVLEHDINDQEILRRKVRLTADKLCFQLKRKNLGTGRFLLSLRYTDNRVARKAVYLKASTSDFLTVAGRAEQAFRELYSRRVGLKSFSLVVARPTGETKQLDLFDTPWERKQKDIGSSVTKIRTKNSFTSIVSASNIETAGGSETFPSC